MCKSILGTGDTEKKQSLALTVSSVAVGHLFSRAHPLLRETDPKERSKKMNWTSNSDRSGRRDKPERSCPKGEASIVRSLPGAHCVS